MEFDSSNDADASALSMAAVYNAASKMANLSRTPYHYPAQIEQFAIPSLVNRKVNLILLYNRIRRKKYLRKIVCVTSSVHKVPVVRSWRFCASSCSVRQFSFSADLKRYCL